MNKIKQAEIFENTSKTAKKELANQIYQHVDKLNSLLQSADKLGLNVSLSPCPNSNSLGIEPQIIDVKIQEIINY